MNKLKLFKNSIGGGFIRTIIISLFATLACVGIIKAATTIGNNISTDGTIIGSGANTLYGATSVGGALTATSTLAVSGAAALNSTLGVLGASTLTGSLTVYGNTTLSNLTATGTLSVTGLTTLGNASTTFLSVSGNSWLSTATLSGNLTINNGALDMSGETSSITVENQSAGTSYQQLKFYDHFANNNGIAALGLYRSCGTIDSPADLIFPTCAGHVGGFVTSVRNNGGYNQTNTFASLVSGLWDYKLYPDKPETWIHIGNNDNADSSTYTYGHRFVVYPEGTAVWPGGLDVIDNHVNYGFTVAGSAEIYDTTTLGNEVLTAPSAFSNAAWILTTDGTNPFFKLGDTMRYDYDPAINWDTGEFTQQVASFANPAPNGARYVVDVDYVISNCGTLNANLDYFLVNTNFAKTDPKEASSANINTSLTMWNMPTGQGGTLIGVGAGGYSNEDTGQKYGGTSYKTLVTGADSITGITIKVKAHNTCRVVVSKVSVKEVKGGDLHLSGDINVGEDANITGKLNINDSIITGKRPGGLAPTVNSACGTGASVAGNDISGILTIGSGSTNGCAVTFNTAYTNAPVCVLGSDIDGDILSYYATATFFIVRRQGGEATTVNSSVSYICMGQD